ncbi:uncharacterized protein LOC114974732 [Acropora millepora]|uniref:uncharacterized protein LOC114974732 n=1 Tax=Acropora millepora TaxID=45264 RepID=UPI001CF5B00B|nr:uncharacterized protein LOC114974732 [Acropora millepora]
MHSFNAFSFKVIDNGRYCKPQITNLLHFVSLSSRTITRKFLCLSAKDKDRVPTTVEKLRLKRSGLGEKKVLLPVDAAAEAVTAILYDTAETVHLDDSEMNNVENDRDNEEPVESNTEPDKEKNLTPFELHRQKAIEVTLTSM